jgi:chemotaxis protein CheD
MNKKIIGIGEYISEKAPMIIVTLGLGSCVGVCIRDKAKNIGGMVHVMLPQNNSKENLKPGKYADTGIDLVLEGILKQGGEMRNLEAKIAGGAAMFGNSSKSMDIGKRNIEAVKSILKSKNIKIISEETAGNRARSIEYDLQSGNLQIKKVGGGEKVEILII